MTDTPTTIAPDLVDVLNRVHGFLSLAEAELLYRLAAEVPAHGIIVEIGSYQGRSTVCLGLGAKQVNALVVAIDPHEDMQIDEKTHYGMENNAKLLKNLVDFGVADKVQIVALYSDYLLDIWIENYRPIDLLWIDGDHGYDSVHDDLLWSNHITDGGKIALHDTSGHYPDVSRALDEILEAGQWVIDEQVDATTVLRHNLVARRSDGQPTITR